MATPSSSPTAGTRVCWTTGDNRSGLLAGHSLLLRLWQSAVSMTISSVGQSAVSRTISSVGQSAVSRTLSSVGQSAVSRTISWPLRQVHQLPARESAGLQEITAVGC